MKNESDYIYLIEPKNSGTTSADSKWKDKSVNSWACAKCHAPKMNNSVVNTTILEENFKDDIGFVYWFPGFLILSDNLIETIGHSIVSSEFNLGTVSTKAGYKLLENLKTATPKEKMVALRGGPDSKLRVCDDCGFIFYYNLGRKYINYPASNKMLYYSHIGLFVHKIIAEKQMKNLKLLHLNIEKIPIIQKVEDGYPDDLNHLPKGFNSKK